MSPRYVLQRCWSDGRTKSVIASNRGNRALSSERRYLTRIVPGAVLHDLVTGRWGAAAILTAGIACAAAGYGSGRLRTASRRFRRPSSPAARHAAGSNGARITPTPTTAGRDADSGVTR
jgi:hypothetical protein